MPPGAEKSLDSGKITTLISVDSDNLGYIMTKLADFIVRKKK